MKYAYPRYTCFNNYDIKNLLINMFKRFGPMYYKEIMDSITFTENVNQKGVYACLKNNLIFIQLTNKKYYLRNPNEENNEIELIKEYELSQSSYRSHPIFSLTRTTDFDKYIKKSKKN